MKNGARAAVPTAFAAYPDPRSPAPPREWMDRGYDVVRWRDMPRGGHFAAMEVPDLFVETSGMGQRLNPFRHGRFGGA